MAEWRPSVDPMAPVPDLSFGDEDSRQSWADAFAEGMARRPLQAPAPGNMPSPLAAFLTQFAASGLNDYAARRYAGSPRNPENRLALSRANIERQKVDKARADQDAENRVKSAQAASKELNERKKALREEIKEREAAEKAERERVASKPGTPEYDQARAQARQVAADKLEDEVSIYRALRLTHPREKQGKGSPSTITLPDGTQIISAGGLKPPTASEREALAKDLTALEQVQAIGKLVKDTYVGPASTARGLGAKFTDRALIPGEADFRGALAIYRNAVINALSGAAVSEAESKRMEQQIPNAADPPGQFRSKMRQTEANVRRVASVRRDTYSRTGIDLSGLAPLPASADSSGDRMVDGIRVRAR